MPIHNRENPIDTGFYIFTKPGFDGYWVKRRSDITGGWYEDGGTARKIAARMNELVDQRRAYGRKNRWRFKKA